jgi:hypothetical protein
MPRPVLSDAEKRERRLAGTISMLLIDEYRSPRGSNYQAARQVLAEDPELLAFFDSVAEAGDDAWYGEHQRVTRRVAAEAAHLPPEMRPTWLRPFALELLPTWRRWGRELISERAAQGSDDPFHGRLGD